MAHPLPLPYLNEVLVFLVAAGIAVPLLHRLRLNPVLGYLLLGMALGPFGLGLWVDEFPWLKALVISDVPAVQRVAELGVIFLLFLIGLELSFSRLWAMRTLVFGLGSLQIALCGVVAWLIARAAGVATEAAIVVAACLALSSTAIVVPLLQEQRQLATRTGQTSFSVLLMQDLAVVPILILVGMLAEPHATGIGMLLAATMTKAVLVVIAIYFIGYWLLRPVMHMVAAAKSAEMFMAATLLLILGTAVATGAAGLSMALGAFLAGLLLAESEFQHRIEAEIEPFKGLLLGLFFMGVGMALDLRLVWEQVWLLALGLLALIVVKTLLIALLAMMFKLPKHLALQTGLLLAQGGEFAFVVVALASRGQVLSPELAQYVLVLVSLSMLLTPGLAALGRRLAHRLAPKVNEDHDQLQLTTHQGHVIIAGFGRVGRTLARMLEQEKQPYMAYDLDAAAVARARAEGLPVYLGDASQLNMLERAQLISASSLVVTTDQHAAADRIVRAVRKAAPALPVFARARDPAHARRLLADGATEVVPEALEASLQLAGRVLFSLGLPDSEIVRRIAQERDLAVHDLATSTPRSAHSARSAQPH